MQQTDTITIGISSCLLGQQVRYDGGHKKLGFATDELARHFTFMPVCPEMAIGLGAPRPTLRLVQGEKEGEKEATRVQQSQNSDVDVTDRLIAVADQTAHDAPHISGYILCAKSPSCGMERVPVFSEAGNSLGTVGRGAFATRLMEKMPLLPVEENGRLNDPLLRENFVLRVTAWHRWQQLNAPGLTPHGLQTFHRRHKFLLLAHNQTIYRELGPLVAGASNSLAKDADRYITHFMEALRKPARRSNHTNTLMHMQGFLKDNLDSEERQDLSTHIEQYRVGTSPLLVPLALIERYARKYQISYLLDQYYFHPYPDDLRLRYGL